MVTEGTDLGFVGGDGGGERLLGFVVEEFAEVEGSWGGGGLLVGGVGVGVGVNREVYSFKSPT